MTSVIISSVIAIFMGIAVTFARMKAAKKPVSAKKIILPPLFMSTGAFMFVFPIFAVTGKEILEAAIIGMLFSILLIKTSKFEVRDNDIYLKRSRAFVFILFGLLAIRIIAKLILSSAIDVGQLSGMFWILAFSMIVPWRIAMLYSYRRLAKQLEASFK
ncbi:CcdC family protein [Niallia sp. NCCP-28]|uniref:CcdC family protein n=1 Tax=Niallia sp. NCCP-28 TaxID=2934712 RepID=UPI002087B27A|nr:cytochrome c biogenesis protein CcdC [Niallia sp. NCCP-28]GKU82759.1 protein CcdC [Niallia sp. NCCP-28]